MSIIEPMSKLENSVPFEPLVPAGFATAPSMTPDNVDAELLRALNEKVAIITGFADRLLESQQLDDIARDAVEAIQRQAWSLREIFVRP